MGFSTMFMDSESIASYIEYVLANERPKTELKAVGQTMMQENVAGQYYTLFANILKQKAKVKDMDIA